jgi:hypothetical protein
MDKSAKRVNTKGYSPNLAARRQRRAAVNRILAQLKEIIRNEVNYRDNIPDNLLDSEMYDRSDYCICNLGEALDILESAYE